MPKKPKKTKASKQAKQGARKQADTLVVAGNAHLERASAACQTPQQLESLALAEAAYQQAVATMEGGVHLDATYNLGICATMRATAAAHLQQHPAYKAANLLAQQQFETVIAADTSGRSETLALAHASLASLIMQSVPSPDSSNSSATASALAAVDTAVDHLAIAVNIRAAAGDHLSVATMQLQAGDAQATAMCWCLASATTAVEAAATAAAVSTAVARCEAACAHYDEGLRSPIAVSVTNGEGMGDVQLLEQKARALHGLVCWGVEHANTGNDTPMPPPFAAAINVAHDCAKALAALLLGGGEVGAAATVGGGSGSPIAGALAAPHERAQAELLVVCGDLFEMCASQHGEPAASEMRANALRLYQCAAEISPIADAYAGAAELLLDGGRAALVRAATATSAAGDAAAGSADTTVAVELLRRSAQMFYTSAQLEPHQSGMHMYNAACAAALLGDDASCKQALGELRAQRTAGGSVAADAVALLADMAQDNDFTRVKHTPWFTAREAL